MMDKKYVRGLLFSVVFIILIAELDILSMHSGLFGTPVQYMNGNFGGDWWSIFFTFNLISISAFAFGYYFFYKRDISETIGILITPIFLWFTGASDALFFWLQGKSLPVAMPWLNHSLIGWISGIFGFENVVPISLLISIAVGIIVAYFVSKELWKIN